MTTGPTHRCPWPACNEHVGAHLWGCRRHWYRLPLEIRNRIYNAYRTGQNMLTASAEYHDAVEAADQWILELLVPRLELERILPYMKAEVQCQGGCGKRPLDGELTCGRVTCGPSTGRR